ncbi:DUF167 domain-containing protein [bacterium]|nr:DUF167 domain-containing protein [bacterium]
MKQSNPAASENMSQQSWYTMEPPDSVVLEIKVIPRARKKEAIPAGPVLKLKINEPAVEGAANKALIKYLSALFDISTAHIVILRGEHNRSKVVKLTGIDYVLFQTVVNRLISKNALGQ